MIQHRTHKALTKGKKIKIKNKKTTKVSLQPDTKLNGSGFTYQNKKRPKKISVLLLMGNRVNKCLWVAE